MSGTLIKLMAFPLIAPADSDGQTYRGFLSVHVHLSDPTHKLPLAVYGEPALQKLLLGKEELLQKRIGRCEDISVLLTDLKEILETCSTYPSPAHISAERYTTLFNEIDKLGFGTVKNMGDTMEHITFEYRDTSERTYEIEASIPADYPLSAPLIKVDLPQPPSALTTTSLTDHIHHIHSLIHQYQDYFNCMDEIDTYGQILDPDHPRGVDTWRRIALTHHCSVHIEIQPDTPRYLPRVRFFGAEKRTTHLWSQWQKATSSWCNEDTPWKNLKCILSDVLIDQVQKEQGQGEDVECGICYAYKLDHTVQETPDTICVNDLCNRGFHPTCLYEWLRSNPNSTRSFNVLFGQCPYCSEFYTSIQHESMT
ncbi:WD-repeat region-domain-containing protein [Spinellus fusiger]|nr:WD-repeat region-domain-containing protein [Spinellus fusiger]